MLFTGASGKHANLSPLFVDVIVVVVHRLHVMLLALSLSDGRKVKSKTSIQGVVSVNVFFFDLVRIV